LHPTRVSQVFKHLREILRVNQSPFYYHPQNPAGSETFSSYTQTKTSNEPHNEGKVKDGTAKMVRLVATSNHHSNILLI
ncbi:MAG: hypothetical protein ACRD82_03750, partial [Blastocatellia bacterium]